MRLVAEIVGWIVIGFGCAFGVSEVLYALAAAAWRSTDRNARAAGMAWVARQSRKKNRRNR